MIIKSKFIHLSSTLSILLGSLLLPFSGKTIATSFDHSHHAYANLLSHYTVADGFSYGKITKPHKATLKQYLKDISSIPEGVYSQWPEPQKLAFLLNLYNANTLDLIVDNYPVDSIRDIGWFGLGPWGRDRVELFGDSISLDDLEHDIIRREFNEPRIHFALVCAAKSCPPLRNEPYIADKLNQQLADQARQFLNQPKKNRLEGSTVVLSKIFDWYGEDFGNNSQQLLTALLPYWPESTRRTMLKIGLENLKIEYSEYDWSLNETH